MTYLLAFILCSPIAVTIIAKLLKRHLDRHYPSMDEREVEAFLAEGLELALAKESAR